MADEKAASPLRATREDLDRLASPGLLGFYDQFEATELIAIRGDRTINLFSLFVAEESFCPEEECLASGWLNGTKPIRIKSVPEWKFGIYRYFVKTQKLQEALSRYDRSRLWSPSGSVLEVEALQPVPPQFIPPDGFGRLPWNGVLKNNFWNGSYVIEIANSTKLNLAEFFRNPTVIQALSDSCSNYMTLGIAALTDRLGNVAIQLPVTVLMAEFRGRGLQHPGELYVNVAWHPKATPRSLRATCEMSFDGLITGFASAEVKTATTGLPMGHNRHDHRGLLWDDSATVIMAATPPSGFIRQISFGMRLLNTEPRIFFSPGEDGQLKPEKISIVGGGSSTLIGEPTDQNAEWTEKRIYTDEVSRLTAQRRFVQYGGQNALGGGEHNRALADLRTLVADNGESGAWLWDPYLSADDLLKTLFWCSHHGADLRGLTAAKRTSNKQKSGAQPVPNWIKYQRDRLEQAKGNVYGLRLEYRAKCGPKGWAFHDRFLIFPRASRGALAWSLGTSVNNLGDQHHILQQVADGQLIADAFTTLWSALDDPKHLIWKTP